MKTVGEILSTLFDKQFMEKAHEYSKFFDSWEDITAKNGIASAAAHSRIKDLDRGIVLVEIDHPGWKQILQTKQSKLLNDFRFRFPEMDISGISLILGTGKPAQEEAKVENIEKQTEQSRVLEEPPPLAVEPAMQGYDAIEDEDLKEKLKKLGQTVAEREKRHYNNT
jgi:rubrerythrin